MRFTKKVIKTDHISFQIEDYRMSKLREEVIKAAGGIKRADYSSEQDFLKACLRAINELEAGDWKSMPRDVQVWYNNGAEAIDKGTPIPSIGEDDAPIRRREIPGDDDSGSTGGGDGDEVKMEDLSEGDQVTVHYKRSEMSGKVISVAKRGFKIQEDGKDEPTNIILARVKKIIRKSAKPSGGGVAAIGTGSEISVDDLKQGMTATIVTARKEITGEILSVSENMIKIKGSDGDERIARKRIKGVRGTGGGDAGAGNAGTAMPDAGGEEYLAAHQTVCEMIAVDVSASKDEVAEMMKEEELWEPVMDQWFGIWFSDAQRLIAVLKEAELLSEDEE